MALLQLNSIQLTKTNMAWIPKRPYVLEQLKDVLAEASVKPSCINVYKAAKVLGLMEA